LVVIKGVCANKGFKAMIINNNRLLFWERQPGRYFPKGTDFHLVSQEAVDEVVASPNSTPRKVLGYQTPSEVFTAHIMQGVRIEA
jgi:IS30 family transposase